MSKHREQNEWQPDKITFSCPMAMQHWFLMLWAHSIKTCIAEEQWVHPGFKTGTIKDQNCQIIVEGFPLSVPASPPTKSLRSTDKGLPRTWQVPHQGWEAGAAAPLPALKRFDPEKCRHRGCFSKHSSQAGLCGKEQWLGRGFLSSPNFGKQGAGFLFLLR